MNNWKLGDLLFRSGPDSQFREYMYVAFHADAFGGFASVIGDFPQF